MKKKRTRKLWTTEEENLIIRSFREDWTWDKLFKALPSRTQQAVIHRADILKKKGKISQKMAHWGSEEDDRVIEGYQLGRAAEDIQRDLPNRTVAAVNSRIRDLRKQGRLKARKGGRSRKIRKKTTTSRLGTNEAIATGEGYDLRGNDENRVLELRSRTIRDPYDALKAANIDLDKWEIKDFIVNKWDMAAKKDTEIEGDPKKPSAWRRQIVVTELWQVKVWLRLKDKNPIKTALDNILQKIGKHAPKYPKIRAKPKGKHLLEISLFDSHFGKLAWGRETGQDYDLKIAQSIYQRAVEDLLNKTSTFGIERILFPVGQDFFHIDDTTNTTPKGGNRLDVDGRLGKIFDTGCESVVRALELCLAVAPVDVIWVPGNHDRQTSMYLCKFLKAWFRSIPERISIDDSPKFRKYKLYGINLLGFTHGDAEKHTALPTIMAGEEPALWAQSQFREWHLGHFHRKKETSYSVGDSHVGVLVRVLPSLCGTDAWHYEMGYVKNRRSAEAYLWNRDEGYAGHLASNVI